MATIVKAETALGRQAAIATAIVVAIFALCFGLFWHAVHMHSYGIRFYVELGTAFVLLVILKETSDFSMIYVRGYYGERRVLRSLRGLPDEYRIFNDITVKVGEDEAQIDHVLVSPYGLWCIETKSHRGMTFGKENEQNWTQVKHSEKGRRYKHKLYNPIRQNATHCRRLADLLGQRLGLSVSIRSIVVFSHGEFRVESVTPVVRPDGLLEVIVAAAQTPVLGDAEIARIVHLLHPTPSTGGAGAVP